MAANQSGYGQTAMRVLIFVAVIYALYKTLDALGLIPTLNYSFSLSGTNLGSVGEVEMGRKAYARQSGYEQNVDKNTGMATPIRNVYLAENEYAGVVKDETTTNAGTPVVKISSPHTTEDYWNFKNQYVTKSGDDL